MTEGGRGWKEEKEDEEDDDEGGDEEVDDGLSIGSVMAVEDDGESIGCNGNRRREWAIMEGFGGKDEEEEEEAGGTESDRMAEGKD